MPDPHTQVATPVLPTAEGLPDDVREALADHTALDRLDNIAKVFALLDEAQYLSNLATQARTHAKDLYEQVLDAAGRDPRLFKIATPTHTLTYATSNRRTVNQDKLSKALLSRGVDPDTIAQAREAATTVTQSTSLTLRTL